MIAHVAAAGEGRGRVVLQLASSGRINEAAIDAALHLATAFQAEVEALFVADPQLFALAQFSFAREIAFSGRASRALSESDVEADLAHLASAMQRRVSDAARALGVPCIGRMSRGELVGALTVACAEPGPWNAVVLSVQPCEVSPDLVAQILSEVGGTTGVVIAGSHAGLKAVAGTDPGPVAAVVEDLDDLPALLRSAAPLSPGAPAGVRLVMLAASDEHLSWMDGQARLALGEAAEDVIVPLVMTDNGAASAIAALNSLAPRLVVARIARPFGGGLASDPQLLDRLSAPLLLLR